MLVLVAERNLREDSRKLPEGQWETILDQGASHKKCPALHGKSTSKWDLEEAPVSWAEGAGTLSANGGLKQVSVCRVMVLCISCCMASMFLNFVQGYIQIYVHIYFVESDAGLSASSSVGFDKNSRGPSSSSSSDVGSSSAVMPLMSLKPRGQSPFVSSIPSSHGAGKASPLELTPHSSLPPGKLPHLSESMARQVPDHLQNMVCCSCGLYNHFFPVYKI